MQRTARIAAVVCALALGGFCVERTRLDSQRHYLGTQRYEDLYFVPPPDWLRVFSLGYREALADLLWTRVLVYFGESMAHRGDSRHLYNYADALLSLDPYFIRAYRWIAITGSYRPKNRGLEDARKAIDYLERAAKLAPDDGLVAWDLGAFYWYDLKPLLTDPREREDASRKGLEHMRVAVLRGAAPPWMTLATANMFGKMGEREQQITFLQEAYEQASSDADREDIAYQIARLRSASFAEAFGRELEQARALRARDFPYLDMELFLQVGPKPAFDHLPLLVHGFDPSAARGAFSTSELGEQAAEQDHTE